MIRTRETAEYPASRSVARATVRARRWARKRTARRRATASVATPRIQNAIRHASARGSTCSPAPMKWGVKTVATVMPRASPVMTTPMPRLRWRSGVTAVIRVRSLE